MSEYKVIKPFKQYTSPRDKVSHAIGDLLPDSEELQKSGLIQEGFVEKVKNETPKQEEKAIVAEEAPKESDKKSKGKTYETKVIDTENK